MPLDLHVLSLPLAFILSQDQTLHCNISYLLPSRINPVSKYLSKELLGFGESLLSPVCYYFIINSKNFLIPISWGDKSNKLFLLHQTFFKVFPTIFFPSDNEGFVSVYFVRPGFQRTCFSFKAGAKVGIYISPPNVFQYFLKIIGSERKEMSGEHFSEQTDSAGASVKKMSGGHF